MTDYRTMEYIHALRESDRFGLQVTAYELIGERAGALFDIPEDFHPFISKTLSQLGIQGLYSHQLQAIDAIRQGRHAVVSTPTASGKSLIYNLSLFELFIRDPNTMAIYLFPLKALTQDQLKGLQGWAEAAGGDAPTAAVYDGDTSAYRRRKIRSAPPNVILTNPEMLHLALLPHHDRWSTLFRNLKLVVIDEVHTYRGLFGSHMAQVIRRLRRICRYYGARPTFVMASATIANPEFLAHQLTGLVVHPVKKSGAPQGKRHMVLMNPVESPAQTAISLLKASMARELRTIVYTQSRKLAELLTLWVQQQSGRWGKRISVYRAGLLPEERRRIEHDLKKGKLMAVVSTSALELGIDIGDLDVCILVGYPGSLMAARQRGGRVGRKGQASAVIMLAGQDALDQYFIKSPEAYFKGEPEPAVINPLNEVVLKQHLVCAAAELPFRRNEDWISGNGVSQVLDYLEINGALLRSADGGHIHALKKRPHHKVDLRSAGKRFRLMDGQNIIGEMNDFRLYRETHPGAVYLHQGQTYLVMHIDEVDRSVHLQPAQVDYYTRVQTDSDIDVIQIHDFKYIGNTKVCLGKVKVTDQVTGFLQIHRSSGRRMGRFDLDVPPAIFTTDSVWFEIAPHSTDSVSHAGHDLLGALHAAEHAAIGILPLVILADRNDMGGLATPYHRQTDSAVIFIYDGIPGGAGLSRQAYQRAQKLLESAAAVIQGCDCDQGCPACVHSPKCGSGNSPMDKAGGGLMLRSMLMPSSSAPKKTNVPLPRTPRYNDNEHRMLHYGVFDLETQRSAREVGGWHMAHLMRVSCGVVYDSRRDAMTVYLEDRVEALIDHLKRFDRVVGFNSKRFDYQVLSGYSDYDFSLLPSVDLLELVHTQLGFRLSLDHLAEQTLGMKKSGSGLDALRWWQAGQIEKIIDYCKTDVQITRDLFVFACNNGFMIYRQKSGERFRIPLSLKWEDGQPFSIDNC